METNLTKQLIDELIMNGHFEEIDQIIFSTHPLSEYAKAQLDAYHEHNLVEEMYEQYNIHKEFN